MRLGRRRGHIDHVARFAQAEGQQFAKLALVLDEENAFFWQLRSPFYRAQGSRAWGEPLPTGIGSI
jgi:hypothetical protein